jgi:hypothetical protein
LREECNGQLKSNGFTHFSPMKSQSQDQASVVKSIVFERVLCLQHQFLALSYVWFQKMDIMNCQNYEQNILLCILPVPPSKEICI